MKAAETIEEIRSAVAEARGAGARLVGLVPTMGALHDGHFSLMDAAGAECEFVVVSLFVNPTQFGPSEDYGEYPRMLERDLAGCESHGVGAVFAPPAAAMYPQGFATTVHTAGVSEPMEGARRPGHFDGVCTVVAKLLNVVGPDVAYFGAKDYQQVAVIRRMVADLDMPVRIAVCPTVREPDGLALSSRNAYLSGEQRAQAPALFESLCLAEEMAGRGERSAGEIAAAIRRHLADRAGLGEVDYVEIVDPDSLRSVETVVAPAVVALAVRFGPTRLIDNTTLPAPPGGLDRARPAV